MRMTRHEMHMEENAVTGSKIATGDESPIVKGRDRNVEHLVTDMDAAGIAACHARLGAMLQLLHAMEVDPENSVRNVSMPPYPATEAAGRTFMIGDVFLPVTQVLGMDAAASISVTRQSGSHRQNLLQMKIEALCPPMLSRTRVIEPIRSDMSNLFSPDDGKRIAIDALTRLVGLVAHLDHHMQMAPLFSRHPHEDEPGRAAIRAHDDRIRSMLMRSSEQGARHDRVRALNIDSASPYQDARTTSGPKTLSDAAIDWLDAREPRIIELVERIEGSTRVYAFGRHSRTVDTRSTTDDVENLRLRSLSSDFQGDVAP